MQGLIQKNSFFNNCQILIIDDNPDDIFLIEDLITDINTSITVESVERPWDSLKLIAQKNFDLCILDYNMGSLNGLELMQCILDLKIEVPIIVLTGQDDLSLDMKAMDMGAADFLSKRELNLKSLERSMRYSLRQYRDYKALQESQRLLHKAAFYDTLTHLPNRALFLDRLEHAFKVWHRSGQDVAVLFIDLDGFKPINDTFGHDVGDQALKVVANRLMAICRSSDTVARLGGDEFTIMLNDYDSREDVITFARRCLDEICLPIEFNTHDDINLGASVGVALVNEGMLSHEELLRSADIAMYQAKNSRNDKVVVYESLMYKELSEQIHLEQELRQASQQNEFELLYQPIICLATGEVFGFEALLRWRKNNQLLKPALFLDTAEQTGQIIPMSNWILKKACSWASTVLDDTQINITVNVSPKQFQDNNFIESIQQALEYSGLKPSHLHLEISETFFMKDLTYVRQKIESIKSLGIKVYLDDFGAGHSSLMHILEFPIDAIKIDRSFIKKLPDAKSEAIIEGLLTMANTMGLHIIAEGIEELRQLKHLQSLDCEYGQGFLFAEPLTTEQCAVFLNKTVVVNEQLSLKA